MLDFDSAQSRLAQAGSRSNTSENCALHRAAGRVLARQLAATLDLPPADNSAMDGYAIRHADYHAGKQFHVQQRCFAGQKPEALIRGNTIRLFTGSLLPAGADTVAMQEDCIENDTMLEIRQAPDLGSHVRKRGEDVRKGDALFKAGTVIRAAEIALLAAQGYADVPVYPRLKVGVLTTGDELVEAGRHRKTEQIYNANGPMLAALLETMNATVPHVLHAADTEESLNEAFATLLPDCDLILTVGGVSVGEKDLVKPAIEHLGGTLDLWRVCMKPGKPVALARIHDTPVVCLPGNPVSAFAVFTLLVSPLVRAMQGRSHVIPAIQYGELRTNRKFRESREEFLRVRATYASAGMAALQPYPQQGSGIISSLPWADGLARIPVDTTVGNGDVVRYYDFSHWLT